MNRRLIVSMAVVTVIAYSGCSKPGQYVSNKMYGDLDLPIDREAAITVTSFPPSADIRAVIGGKGEGLDCSIPWPVEPLMFKSLFESVWPTDAPVSLQFRQSCVFHDYCYRHGYATYGYTQADCDFMLLQAANRICIQIHDIGLLSLLRTDPGSNRPESCETLAREVLLGVRMGGWGSFKAREHSSFFEFDPLPMHAREYTVARLTRVTPDMAPRVDDQPLLSTPTTFHFSRGHVKIRELQWDPGKKENVLNLREKHFPSTMVPTPPNVSRVAGIDGFVVINRESDTNTGFRLLADFSGGDPDSRALHETRCPERLPISGKPNRSLICDFEASVIRLAPHSEQDPDAARMFAFTHRFPVETFPGGSYYSIGMYWWNLPINTLVANGPPPIFHTEKLANASFRYRFLQSDVNVGDFRKRGCPEVIALGRGIHVDFENRQKANAKTKIADDYRSIVATAFLPFPMTNCPEAELRQISLLQAEEPAVPVRRDSSGTDRFLTLNAGDNESSVRITEYAFGTADTDRHEVVLEWPDGKPLDSSWIQSAVYVIRANHVNGGAKGDRLFFSRVALDQEEDEKFKNDKAPDTLRIEFSYFVAPETGENKWVAQGYSSCKIDLTKQHKLIPKNSPMYKLLWRLPYEGLEKTKKDKEDQFELWHKREMARQWMQSQVIPGYIFDDKKQESHRPIDVAVIFHESPDYLLLLQGMRPDAGQLDQLNVRMPAGDFSFANCSSSASDQS